MFQDKPRLHEKHKAHRPGELRTIAIDVTPNCNLKCEHCYAETFAHVVPVGLDALEKALDEAHAMGVFHLVLQGGEPLADRERLEALLKMCRADETYLNVVTNGWAVDLYTIRWLKSLKVDKITFSLDSGIEEEHDARRLPGSYRKNMEAIRLVTAEGLHTAISIVVTHESLHTEGFSSAYEYALANGIRFDVQIAEPVGKWDARKDLLIMPEDAAFIKKLQVNGPMTANGQKSVYRDIYSGEADHCPAVTEFVSLSADGNLLLCNFLQFTMGNIRDKSIAEMRDSMLGSPWFNGRQPVCLCGENPEFIDKYIVPYIDMPKPLNALEIFHLREHCHA